MQERQDREQALHRAEGQLQARRAALRLVCFVPIGWLDCFIVARLCHLPQLVSAPTASACSMLLPSLQVCGTLATGRRQMPGRSDL